MQTNHTELAGVQPQLPGTTVPDLRREVDATIEARGYAIVERPDGLREVLIAPAGIALPTLQDDREANLEPDHDARSANYDPAHLAPEER